MQQITVKQLESLVERINDALGVPQTPYKEDTDGKAIRGENGSLIANAGTCYLTGAYGGYRIEQMCKGGGSRDLLSIGYDTKRNVWNMAQAYLSGLNAGGTAMLRRAQA